MKSILLLIVTIASFQASAFHSDPSSLEPSQQRQLISTLNQMDEEVLETILSDEALAWYIKQYNQETPAFDLSEQTYEIKHGRIELDFAQRPTVNFN